MKNSSIYITKTVDIANKIFLFKLTFGFQNFWKRYGAKLKGITISIINNSTKTLYGVSNGKISWVKRHTRNCMIENNSRLQTISTFSGKATQVYRLRTQSVKRLCYQVMLTQLYLQRLSMLLFMLDLPYFLPNRISNPNERCVDKMG